MASKTEDDIVALVRKLVADGKTFSISLEDPRGAVVDTARSATRNFSLTLGDGDCIQWVYVPGKGLVCVKHEGD